MSCRSVALGLALSSVLACGGDDGPAAGSESGSSTGGDQGPLAIIGSWIDPAGGGKHDIDDVRWVQRFGTVVYTFDIDLFDNAKHWVVADSANTMKWYRFDWTFAGMQLYYCTSAAGVDTRAAAISAVDPDPADPSAGGCMGGAWTRLDPA